MNLKKLIQLFSDNLLAKLPDISLLILRLGVGFFMIANHGLPKLNKILAGNAHKFGNPLGLGPELSLYLTTFAEFFCSILVILGLFTRLASIPLAFTMFVAIFIVHIDDPLNKIEFASLYFIPYILLLFQGAGKYSVDQQLLSRG